MKNDYITELKDEIKAKLDVYLRIRGREVTPSGNFKCPNSSSHERGDIIPSAEYKPAEGGNPPLWNCQVCKVGGDIFTAAQYIDGVFLEGSDFYRTLRDLAYTLNIEIDEKRFNNSPSIKSDDFVDVYRDIEIFIKESNTGKEALTSGKFGRKYTQDEACEVLKNMPMGSIDTHGLLEFLKKKHPVRYTELPFFNKEKGTLDGLVFSTDRLTFPVRTNTGRPVGFAGRVSVETDKKYKEAGKKFPKYKFTSGLAKKDSSILFWLDIARDNIKETNRVYVVEGPFDAISMWLRGYKNVVALQGTSISGRIIDTLAAYHAYEIYMVLDGDQAAIKALGKTLPLFFGNPITVKAIPMPAGEDPDSLVANGEVTPFENPVDAVTYTLQRHPDFNDDAIPYMYRYNKALDFVTKCTDMNIEFGVYAEVIARMFSRGEKDVLDDIKGHLNRSNTTGRQLNQLTENLAESSHKSLQEYRIALDQAVKTVETISSSQRTTIESYTINYYTSILNNRVPLPRIIKTGNPMLDREARIMCSNLTVWGGRPSNGKSSAIRYLMTKMIPENNKDLFIFYASTDDDTTSSMITMISIMTGVERDSIEEYVMRGTYFNNPAVKAAENEIRDLFTNRMCLMGLDQVPDYASIARKTEELTEILKEKTAKTGRQHDLLVVVDAINDLRDIKKNKGDQRLQVEETYGNFTELARMTGASIHLVNHLIKIDSSYHTSVPRPTLGDLKGSSAIEHDAKTIFLVHMDMHYDDDTPFAWRRDGFERPQPIIEIKVAKDKGRRANQWIPYRFSPEICQIIEMEEGSANYLNYQTNLTDALSRKRGGSNGSQSGNGIGGSGSLS